MTPTRFVYFDLGNVLALFDHQVGVEALAKLSCRSSESCRCEVFDSGLQNAYESGRVDSVEFVAEIGRRLGVELNVPDTLEALSAIFKPNEPILECLSIVRQAGVPLGLLSNTCAAHWEWLRRQKWSTIEGWFDVLVLSYEVGCMKPDPGIYEHAERMSGCAGQSIFFTDDRIENIHGAARHGWATYQFESAAGLRTALDGWLAQAR